MVLIVASLLGVVRALRGRRRAQDPRPDPAPIGGTEAERVLRDLRDGDLHSLGELLLTARHGQWDKRDLYCNLLAEAAADPLLDAWCEADESEPLAFLVRGRARIARAWEARGNAPAAFLTEEAWQEVTIRMMAAERDLLRAAELDPADPTPWSYLITVGTTLAYPRPVVDNCFRQALARDAEHFGAHQRMLQHLCEKWHGDSGEALVFARNAAATCSTASDLPILIIDAHIEHWLYLRDFERLSRDAKAALRESGTLDECLNAYERSLGSASSDSRASTMLARNIAATWFYLVRDRKRLRQELAKIRNAWTADPWAYLEEPQAAYARATQYAKGLSPA